MIEVDHFSLHRRQITARTLSGLLMSCFTREECERELSLAAEKVLELTEKADGAVARTIITGDDISLFAGAAARNEGVAIMRLPQSMTFDEAARAEGIVAEIIPEDASMYVFPSSDPGVSELLTVLIGNDGDGSLFQGRKSDYRKKLGELRSQGEMPSRA